MFFRVKKEGAAAVFEGDQARNRATDADTGVKVTMRCDFNAPFFRQRIERLAYPVADTDIARCLVRMAAKAGLPEAGTEIQPCVRIAIQKFRDVAAMVVMPVTEHQRIGMARINAQSLAVGNQCRPLSGVEKNFPIVQFNPGGKAVLA